MDAAHSAATQRSRGEEPAGRDLFQGAFGVRVRRADGKGRLVLARQFAQAGLVASSAGRGRHVQCLRAPCCSEVRGREIRLGRNNRAARPSDSQLQHGPQPKNQIAKNIIMKKLLKNFSLLAVCAASLTISGCAASDQGATAGQSQSLNSTGAGVGGAGTGGTGVGGVGNSGIGSGGATGGLGAGGTQSPGGGR